MSAEIAHVILKQHARIPLVLLLAHVTQDTLEMVSYVKVRKNSLSIITIQINKLRSCVVIHAW